MEVQHLVTRLWIGAVAAALAAAPAAATEVVLKSRAAPQGTVVRLGDLAEINTADSRETLRLAALPLMPTPAEGKVRFLRLREVQDLLESHGEDISGWSFRGESAVEIGAAGPPVSRFRAAWTGQPATGGGIANATKVAATLSADQIAALRHQLDQLFVDYLDTASGRKGNWQVEFEMPPADWASLAGATSDLKCAGGYQPWTGRQRFIVTFNAADGAARIPVVAMVKSARSVLVATRPIERGKLITAADVEIREMDIVAPPSGRQVPLETLEGAVGNEATRAIDVGAVVMSDDVRPQLLVKRGEVIAVYARGGGIQVRTLARARQDGARGELINVESLQEKRQFQASVAGVREAMVFAGNSSPEVEAVVERPFSKLRQ